MTAPIILCATDLTESGRRAADLASAWAASIGGRVELLHITDRADETWLEAVPVEMQPAAIAMRARLAERETAAREGLAEVEARCLSRGIECRGRVLGGRPWETIVAEAKAIDAQLVVVGPHGGGTRLLGTTAARVVRHSPCSVLVATGTGPVPAALEGARWVVGVDFAPESRRALEQTAELVAETDGELALAHAVTTTPLVGFEPEPLGWSGLVDTWKNQATVRLAKLAREIGVDDPVQCHAGTVGAAELLHEVAADDRADFIVVGSHGRKGLVRLALGSTAERTLRGAPVPVLVVRELDAS